ncbi:MAG: flagellar M-ring protein FliF [Treponema sp.]|nr:flagellar M-ring protein FliF [Treponema sp.]
MNEWLKKFTASLKERWAKWSIAQKIILIGIVVAVIAAIVVTSRVSSAPTTVPLFNTPVTNQDARDAILFRLEEENVRATVNAAGVISVPDERTARRMRSLLVREDLVPTSVDPFSLFDVSSWTTTDFERNVNLQRSIQRMIKQHIEALDEVASADVVITAPERATFTEDQKPTTASVILTFNPGSNMANERKKIEGVQKLLLKAVVGLKAEDIVITDSEGNQLNNFEGLADIDRNNIIKQQQKQIELLETQLRAKVLKALQTTFGADRVRDLNVKIEMDMSKVSRDMTIYTPIMITEQDPTKPYDTTEKRDSIPISSQTITKEFTGTGFNPEGPAGVEGQNPPVMSDMSNVIGQSKETGVTQNNAINTEHRTVEVSPSMGKRTVSVNIDGQWRIKLDPKTHLYAVNQETGAIEREYVPVNSEVLEQATSYVRDAIGYDLTRGDSVTVTNIPFDRTEQFRAEDEAYFARQRRNRTIMWVLIGVTIVLIAFIVFRFISRELERRRRLREEELLRRQQAEREKALWDARQEGMEVTMSVEERKRAELLESAMAMAKEHPEDVAMLIRTWMMEE